MPAIKTINHEKLSSLYDFVEAIRTEFSELPFCADRVNGEYRRFTYKDFGDKVFGAAASLMDMGIIGKHIAVFSNSRFECYVLYCAVMLSGNVYLPINIDIPVEQQKRLIEFADADVVVFSQDLVCNKDAILDGNDRIKECFVMDTPEYDALYSGDPAGKQFYGSITEDRTALMGFTSGSEGLPKAVMMSVKNVMTTVTYGGCFTYKAVKCDDCIMPIPMYHIAALNTLFNVAPLGYVLYLCEKPADFFREVNVYKPHYGLIVPAMAEIMLKIMQETVDAMGKRQEFEKICADKTLTIEERHKYCSQFKVKLGGNFCYASIVGARMPEEMTEMLNNFGFEIRTEYGMTECAQVTCMTETVIPGSVGKIAPQNIVKIEDEILYIKGDNVMRGYYKNPEKTREILSEDGWLCTGDRARMDEDGNLYILGRKDNIIVLKDGENIDAIAIEKVMSQIELIEEIIVIADKARGNESLCALIYPKDGTVGENIEKAIGEEIQKINKTLSMHHRILRFRLEEKPFEKNSKMVIRRGKYVDTEL